MPVADRMPIPNEQLRRVDQRARIFEHSVDSVFGVAKAASSTYLLGNEAQILAGQAATYAGAALNCQGAYVELVVNSITGGDDVTFAGDVVYRYHDGVPSVGVSKIINITAPGRYMFMAGMHWLSLTGITIGGSITAINYDVNIVQPFELGSQGRGSAYGGAWNEEYDGHFTLEEWDVIAEPNNVGVGRSIQIEIERIERLGTLGADGAVQRVVLEDITFSDAAGIADGLRGGADARGYANANIILDAAGETFWHRQADLSHWFSANEARLRADDGLLVKVTWSDIDYVRLRLIGQLYDY